MGSTAVGRGVSVVEEFWRRRNRVGNGWGGVGSGAIGEISNICRRSSDIRQQRMPEGKKGTPSLSAGGASCGIWKLKVPGGPKAGRIEARSGMLVEVIWRSASTLPPRATLSLPQCPDHRHSGADGRQGDGSGFGDGDDAVLDEQI